MEDAVQSTGERSDMNNRVVEDEVRYPRKGNPPHTPSVRRTRINLILGNMVHQAKHPSQLANCDTPL